LPNYPRRVEDGVFVCKSNLELLAKHSPHYQRKHLHSLVASAKQRGDLTQASKIVGILQKEACQKCWRQVNRSTRKACGGLPTAVKVPTVDEGYVEYKTQEGVFQAVSATLVERFQLALVAQCHRGTFFEDVDHLADGLAAQQIREGTYVYPPDLNPATRLLFKEAAHTYAILAPMEIATYVTAKDFQHFWQTAREQAGLFFSGLHFGHYISASFCPDLLVLHTAKLSVCAHNGVPLAWWGKGLTVLLEKILGNIFVHKLRAICLRISQECFAKKNSYCNHAVLTKLFFCDSSQVLHHPAGMVECDFGDCYDHTAHPPTSIALQSWGIPKLTIRVLLTSMQTMQYVLKTSFGESTESYGGTAHSPNSGLGQGNGASPPGFLALSSLIVNAYQQMGHGAQICSSYTAHLFVLVAVMYVNDTDMLHWPPSPHTSPEELIEHVQQATMDWGNLTQASGGILKAGKSSA
jgi:hypothetical protein